MLETVAATAPGVRRRRSGVVNAILVVGVLVALAVPSYLSHVQRAETQRAEANLNRAAVAADLYRETHGTYVGMFNASSGLRRLDPSLDAGLAPVIVTDLRYCLKDVEGKSTAWIEGPGGIASDMRPSDCS